MDEIIAILTEIGVPFSYNHFAEGESPSPPFICWLIPGTDNFAADGMAFFKINNVRFELYTDIKDLPRERMVETVLDSHGIFYEKTETFIESEKLYEVMYSFQMED